jgi:chromosome segregation ATPase
MPAASSATVHGAIQPARATGGGWNNRAVNERAVEDVRRLAARDAGLAAEADRLRRLADEAEDVRARAEATEMFFASYTEEERRLREATADAREELERRRAEAAQAQTELEAARRDEERVAAERAVARARDRLADAEARIARGAEAEAELERHSAALTAEIPSLEQRAAAISSQLRELPPAPRGPSELIDWASRARTHVFVTAGQIDSQRDRLIREANELGSMLLGEPVYGSTADQILDRIEATIGRLPS